jgi:ribonuclease-3
MNDQQKKLLKTILLDPNPDFNQKIREFITIFNSDSSDPYLQSGTWDISKEEWQRYEFLGDRFLNLVAADYLYHHAPSKREGEMTKMMGVVSNDSLTGIIERNDFNIALLIPETIGRQQTYGERIKGGALEAFIGAVYVNAGFEDTCPLIRNLLSEEIKRYDPATNYIGRLQEWHQQRGLPVPIYSEITEKRDGPDHSPRFTYRVNAGDGSFLGEGTGRNRTEAKQAAAHMALDKLPEKPALENCSKKTETLTGVSPPPLGSPQI